MMNCFLREMTLRYGRLAERSVNAARTIHRLIAKLAANVHTERHSEGKTSRDRETRHKSHNDANGY